MLYFHQTYILKLRTITKTLCIRVCTDDSTDMFLKDLY